MLELKRVKFEVKGRGIFISLFELIILSIPEFIIMYMITDKFLNRRHNIKRLLITVLLYLPICYIIKNIFPADINFLLVIVIIMILYAFYSNEIIIKYILSLSVAIGLKFICEIPIVMFLNIINVDTNYLLSTSIFKSVIGVTVVIIYYYLYKLISNKRIILYGYKKNKDKYFINALISVAIINVIVMGVIVRIILDVNNVFDKYDLFLLIPIILASTCLTGLVIGISVIDRKRDITMIENNLISKNLEQMEETEFNIKSPINADIGNI